MPFVDPSDLHKLADQIRYDLTSAQAKITSLKAMLSQLNLPAEAPVYLCAVPSCGIGFGSAHRLAEHLENVHGTLPPDVVLRLRGSPPMSDVVAAAASVTQPPGLAPDLDPDRARREPGL